MAAPQGLEEIPEGKNTLSQYIISGAEPHHGVVKFTLLTYLRFTGQIESNYDEVIESFDDMKLKPELLRGMYIRLHWKFCPY